LIGEVAEWSKAHRICWLCQQCITMEKRALFFDPLGSTIE